MQMMHTIMFRPSPTTNMFHSVPQYMAFERGCQHLSSTQQNSSRLSGMVESANQWPKHATSGMHNWEGDYDYKESNSNIYTV